MSDNDFNIIHMSPRAQVQTPPPRGFTAAFMHGDTFAIPQPAGMNKAGTQAAATDEGVEEVDRLARWLEKKEMEQDNKYNRTVTISPLPDTLTVADVLPRVRGGVDSCYVSQFEETRVAVVTFKRAADAITYAAFCAESPIWDLWTFQISRPGVPFTWERRAKVQLYKAAPGMGSAWNPGDIPTEPRPVLLPGSRCLMYKGCKPHEVAGIYRALGLHKSQHMRDQVEGMWLDGPVRDGKGDPARGCLHVWYTSIRAAQEARVRVTALEFEYDPCSDSPEKLMLHLDEGDEVPIFRHHEPFVDLLELNEKTILAGILDGAIDPINAYWRCRAPLRPFSENMATLAGRLQWSLQANNGQPMAPTFPAAYQPPDVYLPPATLSDPFLDSQPIAAGFPPRPRDQGAPSYQLGGGLDAAMPAQYQPFAASRDVPPGYLVSPLETYVARSQERQALGFPPYSNTASQDEPAGGPVQRPGCLKGDTNKNGGGGVGGPFVVGSSARGNTANRYSNLGGAYNNPQSGSQPRSGFYDS